MTAGPQVLTTACIEAARRPGAVVLVVLATLAGGIALDARGPWWGQGAVAVWAWAALAWVCAGAAPAHRRELAACVALATLGELFLMDVWGLYHYRLGNLPPFIPPGHALVFAAATRIARAAPAWLPWAVASPVGVYLAVAGAMGLDTQGVLWFCVFLAYLAWCGDRALSSVLFLFALLVEAYGTRLGGWTYHAREPWFGLTTTNPPVAIGAIYCTLETLVRAATAVASRVAAPGDRADDQNGYRSPTCAAMRYE